MTTNQWMDLIRKADIITKYLQKTIEIEQVKFKSVVCDKYLKWG